VDNILPDRSVRTLCLTRHCCPGRAGERRAATCQCPPICRFYCSLWYYYRDSSPLASPTLNERVRRLITDVSISILLELRRMTYVGISFRAFQGHGVRLTYHAARLSLRPTSTLAQRSPHWQQLSDHKRNVQVSILLMFTNYFRGPCPCPRPSHF
jgi:hypothetical protein